MFFSCILPSFVSKNKSPGSTRDGKVSELVKCLLAIFASLETTTIVRGCKCQSSTKSRTKKKKATNEKKPATTFFPTAKQYISTSLDNPAD